MVERICPQCQHGNPLANRFCGRCGTTLEHPLTKPRQEETGLALARNALPAPLNQVGKAVLVSLATLAAEAGLAWLRNRVDQMNARPTTLHQPAASAQQTQTLPQMTRPAAAQIVPAAPTRSTVTILSQRVVQIWEHGLLTRETVERTIWRREE